MQNPDKPNFSDWHPSKHFQERKEFCNFYHVITEFNSVKICTKDLPVLYFDR